MNGRIDAQTVGVSTGNCSKESFVGLGRINVGITADGEGELNSSIGSSDWWVDFDIDYIDLQEFGNLSSDGFDWEIDVGGESDGDGEAVGSAIGGSAVDSSESRLAYASSFVVAFEVLVWTSGCITCGGGSVAFWSGPSWFACTEWQDGSSGRNDAVSVGSTVGIGGTTWLGAIASTVNIVVADALGCGGSLGNADQVTVAGYVTANWWQSNYASCTVGGRVEDVSWSTDASSFLADGVWFGGAIYVGTSGIGDIASWTSGSWSAYAVWWVYAV